MSGATLLTAAFWTGVLATAYAYVLFPALCWAVGRGRHRDSLPEDRQEHPTPPVTVIVPAYNEERGIEKKLRNVLATDYPGMLDVVVVSDASTDRTDQIVRSFEKAGVRLVVQELRSGKTAGLNRAVSVARGEVIVFTDANASYAPGTIAALTARVLDPGVGLVTGYTRYTAPAGGDVVEVTNGYTRLEHVIKAAESRWGCCVGADGAIFAMRRALYRTLLDDDINDFVLPLRVIEQGYRSEFAEGIACVEEPGADMESEFRRQSRITNRTLRALWRNRQLLNPLRFPLCAFFLFSHKVVRFLVPILAAVALASIVLLAAGGGTYLVLALAAIGTLGLAAVSKAVTGLGLGPLRFLAAFLTINVAMLNGWRKFLLGDRQVVWTHGRVASR